MYTELSGRASFLVTVPRSKKATVKSVLFQPLALIEFEADYRPNTSLFRIKEAKSFSPFTSIPYDPFKSAIALFLAEFLYRAIRERRIRNTRWKLAKLILQVSNHNIECCK